MGMALLLAGVCFYIGILYTNQTILLLGYTIVVLLAMSFVEILVRKFTVKCSLEIPITMAEAGIPIAVNVCVKNQFLLPVRRIDVCMRVSHSLGNLQSKQWITFFDCKSGKQSYRRKMELEEAGNYEIELSKIRIYGFFGLISIKKRCRAFDSVLVMPQIYPIGVQMTEAVRNFLGDADVYDDFRPGNDSGETFEVREYQEKDKLQSIHWKLSARTEQLMVKEHSQPKACAVVLFLDLSSDKKIDSEKRNARRKNTRKFQKQISVINAYLELIASLSYCLMDNKCPHFVAWYSKEKEDIRRIRVDDEESFYLFLNCYLKEADYANKDIRSEYREKYKSEWYLYDISVNEKLEIRKNGEFITQLAEKKIVDECEKLELLL